MVLNKTITTREEFLTRYCYLAEFRTLTPQKAVESTVSLYRHLAVYIVLGFNSVGWQYQVRGSSLVVLVLFIIVEWRWYHTQSDFKSELKSMWSMATLILTVKYNLFGLSNIIQVVYHYTYNGNIQYNV